MSSPPIVRFRAASKWYGNVIGLNKLTLDISAGVTGLLGPNGAGKSTLLQLATGQLRPSQGEVLVLGHRPWNKVPLIKEKLRQERNKESTYPRTKNAPPPLHHLYFRAASVSESEKPKLRSNPAPRKLQCPNQGQGTRNQELSYGNTAPARIREIPGHTFHPPALSCALRNYVHTTRRIHSVTLPRKSLHTANRLARATLGSRSDFKPRLARTNACKPLTTKHPAHGFNPLAAPRSG